MIGMAGCKNHATPETEYGVFIGLSPEDAAGIRGYATLVIDADMFSKAEVEKLHKADNAMVYSYLNIGSIETFRDGYFEFEGMSLGAYENWPEERWMDVSQPLWKEYLTRKAKDLAEKGVDGFFLDNADVWYVYPRPEIYQGLLDILHDLQPLGLPLIINGGDTFVSAALENGDLTGLIDGINQETVFTSINFEQHTFGSQNPDEKACFQKYLAQCKKAGLRIYLTEYGADEDLTNEIKTYCAENGFSYYISPSLELDDHP